MEILPQLLLIIVLVLLNGFFVASEFSLVAIRRTRINLLIKRRHPIAPLVKKALNDLDTYISATQLGITIASIGLGWAGEPALAHFLLPIFARVLPSTLTYFSAHTLASIIAFAVITFLHIVLGELAPKTLALERAERTAFFIIAPLTLFTKIFHPFVWILNTSGNLVLHLFGLTPLRGHQLVHSEEEIKMILSHSATSGAIEPQEAEMMHRIFQFADLYVEKIMVPKRKIVAIDYNSPVATIYKKIKKHYYSRYPVFRDSLNIIVGFVHIKDIYKLAQETNLHLTIKDANITLPIIHVTAKKRADEVFLLMRKRQLHMAVVHESRGRTIGIVTLEDIIESILGKIKDEFEAPLYE